LEARKEGADVPRKKDDMEEEKKNITRRQVVAGLGTTLIAGAVSPLLADTGTTNDLTMETKPLDDPTKKYPKPPFESQSQPWPGRRQNEPAA